VSADIRSRWTAPPSRPATATSSRRHQEHGRILWLRDVGAGLAIIFIYMILASQFKSFCSRWR
jgi:hypothetical protein